MGVLVESYSALEQTGYWAFSCSDPGFWFGFFLQSLRLGSGVWLQSFPAGARMNRNNEKFNLLSELCSPCPVALVGFFDCWG